jgi:hypothetical protein
MLCKLLLFFVNGKYTGQNRASSEVAELHFEDTKGVSAVYSGVYPLTVRESIPTCLVKALAKAGASQP